MPLVFDIETVPTLAALAAPYPEAERQPPSTYKNPEAIAGWVERDRAAWLEARVKECSLTPRLGRVVALGVRAMDDPEPFVQVAQTEDGEADLLRFFWEVVADSDGIAGFNSMAFDLPFLVTRSLIHGLTIPVRVPDYLRRYAYAPHFDVRMALTAWDVRASGTLGDWCEAFGIPRPTGSGADVWTQVQAGDWDAIVAHCAADVNATHALVHRVAPTYGVSL